MNRDEMFEFGLSVSAPAKVGMTEAEWLTSTDPMKMIEHLPGEVSERKLRLFNALCVRALWDYLSDQRSRDAVLIAEEFADGRVTTEALSAAYHKAFVAWRELDNAVANRRNNAELDSLLHASHSAQLAAFCGGLGVVGGIPITRSFAIQHIETVIIVRVTPPWPIEGPSDLALAVRDMFGNPFRPVAFDPAWRTDTAVSLAKGMYGSRDFGAMPILADALQDAGCDSDDILNHCRGPGPHVRGCWVVDLVLGKA